MDILNYFFLKKMPNKISFTGEPQHQNIFLPLHIFMNFAILSKIRWFGGFCRGV